MKNWIQGILFPLGGLLLLLGLSSALLPDAEREDERYALSLRQVGHDYLRAIGDSTSRIPEVVVEDDGALLLPLACYVDYTLLTEVARRSIQTYGIRNSYTLSLYDCETGERFLGGLWTDPSRSIFTSAMDVACTGRDQETRCADIALNFHVSDAVGTGGHPLYLLIPGLLLLIVGGVSMRRKPRAESPAEARASIPEKSALSLGQNVLFDATAQTLSVASSSYDLTYRESKLFAYLAANPNAVLRREDIHDAVWGDEGIIVGRSLDVFISRLRKKLADAEGLEIATVHGVGYRLVA